MGFYLVPYCQPNPPTRFLPITTIGICHFRHLWNGMFGRVEGQYTTYVLAGHPAFPRPCVGVHRRYIAYKFILTSPAEHHMSGSSNLDSFRDRVGCAATVLWGVASRTCSIQLAAFLCISKKSFINQILTIFSFSSFFYFIVFHFIIFYSSSFHLMPFSDKFGISGIP